jgi:hypothetical protein
MTLLDALYNELILTSLFAALYFLRAWWRGREGFYLWFTSAFLTLGASWAALEYSPGISEHSHYIYLVRLSGFLQILGAITTKATSSAR